MKMPTRRIRTMRDENVSISRPFAIEKTLQFANALRYDQCLGSNGWLDAFQKRHRKMRRESRAKIVEVEIGGVAIYRPFGEFRRANSYCHLYSAQGLGQRQATATGGSDVVQSGRPIFDDFFQHLGPYIGNNTANVVFQMVKRLWLIRIDQ
ncbi:hypothetical protein TNCV_522851 [Trichonephila clavipes]|nr:hypothetical protein TNCV_522851 [Trichonephila clavipes]